MTAEPLTVVEVLRRTREYLATRGADAPRLDAELLLADVLRCDRLALYTGFDRPLTRAETDAYRAHVARRARREPVAYILGTRAFRNLTLTVSPSVLIPRPETELLVEWALAVAPSGGRVLDWGTGSGAIALALAHERPDLVVSGLERSEAALAVARVNDPDGRVEWLLSDGFAGCAGRRFDVIVANPPYIPAAELPQLAPELGFEPADALVSGPTGLEAFQAIAADGPGHLDEGGWLLAEIGMGQGEDVMALWRGVGLASVATRADLAGIDRVVAGRR